MNIYSNGFGQQYNNPNWNRKTQKTQNTDGHVKAKGDNSEKTQNQYRNNDVVIERELIEPKYKNKWNA